MRHASVALTDSVYSHYQIDDLKKSLNGRHPLIMKGLNTENVFEEVKREIESLEVFDDSRFITKVIKDKSSLFVEILLE